MPAILHKPHKKPKTRVTALLSCGEIVNVEVDLFDGFPMLTCPKHGIVEFSRRIFTLIDIQKFRERPADGFGEFWFYPSALKKMEDEARKYVKGYVSHADAVEVIEEKPRKSKIMTRKEDFTTGQTQLGKIAKPLSVEVDSRHMFPNIGKLPVQKGAIFPKKHPTIKPIEPQVYNPPTKPKSPIKPLDRKTITMKREKK